MDSNALLALEPGNYKRLYCPLTNLGTIRLTGNTVLYLDSGSGAARLVNLNLLDSTGNDTFTSSGTSGGVLDNRAYFTKSGGTAASTVNSTLLFLHSGTVTVLTNSLNIWHGILTGTFNGPGKTVLTGTHTFTGDLTAQNMELQSGRFDGDGARLHGAFTWVTGELRTKGVDPGLTFARDCTFALVPGNFKYLLGSLTNFGAVLLTGSTALYLDNAAGNARLMNLGLVDSQGNDLLTHSGTTGGVLENRAYWRKRAGVGSTTLPSTLQFIHGGALEAFTGAFQLTGGSFINAGGTMRFRLNSDTDYGQIHFSGIASLGGGLASQVGPGYHPVPGATFPVLTCTGTNGQFATYDLSPGYTWSVLTTNTYTQLTVTGRAGGGSPAWFRCVEQISANIFDLHLLVEPNKAYGLEARSTFDPSAPWHYPAPFSSSTSNYTYRHTVLGSCRPRNFSGRCRDERIVAVRSSF